MNGCNYELHSINIRVKKKRLKLRLIEKFLVISFFSYNFVTKINSPFNIYSIMKKTTLTLLAAMTLMLSSCFTTGLGTTSTNNSTSSVLGSVLSSVLTNVLLGGMTYDQSGLLGSWSYSAPSAAFTTEKALTNAGGTAAVANIASSLASNYSSIGYLPTLLRRWQVTTAASVSTVATLPSHFLKVTSSRLR